MIQPMLRFADIIVKQRVEEWADGLDFDPTEQLRLVLGDKFGTMRFLVHDAQPEGDFIILKISTDRWLEPREFALFQSGSLVY